MTTVPVTEKPSSFEAEQKNIGTDGDIQLPSSLDEPPDGGLHAWMTVAAAWLISFIGFGIASIWGVFQDAYMTQSSSSFRNIGVFKLGFVGGCAMGFSFCLGPFSNVLIAKLGIRAPICLGVVMIVLSFELASISHKYWELLLSQGILFG